MTSFQNSYDELEKIIYENGLRIKALHFHKDLDLMLIVLNNKKTLHRNISEFSKLHSATPEELENFELIAGGTGVHWPTLDEDLGLKGFLKSELQQSFSLEMKIFDKV